MERCVQEDGGRVGLTTTPVLGSRILEGADVGGTLVACFILKNRPIWLSIWVYVEHLGHLLQGLRGLKDSVKIVRPAFLMFSWMFLACVEEGGAWLLLLMDDSCAGPNSENRDETKAGISWRMSHCSQIFHALSLRG